MECSRPSTWKYQHGSVHRMWVLSEKMLIQVHTSDLHTSFPTRTSNTSNTHIPLSFPFRSPLKYTFPSYVIFHLIPHCWNTDLVASNNCVTQSASCSRGGRNPKTYILYADRIMWLFLLLCNSQEANSITIETPLLKMQWYYQNKPTPPVWRNVFEETWQKVYLILRVREISSRNRPRKRCFFWYWLSVAWYPVTFISFLGEGWNLIILNVHVEFYCRK